MQKIKSYIKHLKHAPDHKGQKFALSLSLTITAIIVVVWAATLDIRINQIYAKSDGKDTGIFDGISDNFANALNSLKNIGKDGKEVLNDGVKGVPTIELVPMNK